MLRTISDLSDQKYYGKKVLVRVDFNITLNDTIVGEDYRIRMTIPTIEYLTKRGAKVILMSHLGRPTQHDSHYSLAAVAKRLSEMMPINKVRFAKDCVGPVAQKSIDEMDMGQILLLENLRFHEEEKANDPEFSKQLASLANIYDRVVSEIYTYNDLLDALSNFKPRKSLLYVSSRTKHKSIKRSVF